MIDNRRVVTMPTNRDERGFPICPECGCNQSELMPGKSDALREQRMCDYCYTVFYVALRQAEANPKL